MTLETNAGALMRFEPLQLMDNSTGQYWVGVLFDAVKTKYNFDIMEDIYDITMLVHTSINSTV